jgi:class 3 adenylate cyclase
MRLANKLETRIAQHHFNELQRRQFVIDFAPAVVTFVATVILGAIFLRVGLRTPAWLYLAYAVAQGGATAVALAWPRRKVATAATLITTLGGITVNFLAHLSTGGFESSLLFIVWVIVTPSTVFLAGAPREGPVVLGVALTLVVAALALDARLAPPPDIPRWVRVVFNGHALLTGAMLPFLWGLYVLRLLDDARSRADDLLLNILPAPIATRLKRDTSTIADGYDEVTVLFADIVDFTTMSADADPVDVVNFLNDIFSDFDDLAAKHGLEKIKTIGDAYMVAGGLPTPRLDHCEAVVAFGLEMLAAVKRRTAWHGEPVRMRVGVNTGPVVAGVIGRRKFIYDLWGDAVNTASRMESNGVADVIQVTAAVKEKLAGRYAFEERPPVYIRGKGMMVTYTLRPPVEKRLTNA